MLVPSTSGRFLGSAGSGPALFIYCRCTQVASTRPRGKCPLRRFKQRVLRARIWRRGDPRTARTPLATQLGLVCRTPLSMCPIGAYMCHRGRLGWSGTSYILVFLGFGPVFGQSWAQERAQRHRLEKCYINQRKRTREIDSKTLVALICVIGVVWAGPGPPA